MVLPSEHSTEENEDFTADQWRFSTKKNQERTRQFPVAGSAAVIPTAVVPHVQTQTKKSKKKKAELTAEEAAERKRRIIYRWKIIVGLSGPFILQSFNSTILASAYPHIATDFGTYIYCASGPSRQ